jgi:replicative DNA helicase
MSHNETERIIADTMNHVKSSSYQQTDSELKEFIPRTITEVALERKSEKELEKLAPKTGYPELDRIVVGFVPGHVYTVTGNTNVGKSSIACNFAERLRRQGKKTLYFALEPENTVVDYLASVRTAKMFTELTEEDVNFDDGNIGIYGKQEVSTLNDLISAVSNSKTRYDLIVIDHIGYFIQEKENWVQEQSRAIKKLAGLAKSKMVAILIIAHLRKRSTADKKDYTPTADDISGSGAFKQDSTEVMIIVRPNETNDPDNIILSNYGKLYVVKTKCGPNGTVNLMFATKKALIISPEEMENEEYRKKLSIKDELTLLGFPDKKEEKSP